MRPTKTMTTNLRIYYLSITSKTSKLQHSCTTVATDLDEALRRATLYYGPVRVNSSGTRIIPHTLSEIAYGKGDFLPSCNDQHLAPSVLEALAMERSQQ